MTARRSRGDGSIYWDQPRQRWIATIAVGFNPAGKRITRKASGRTKTEARTKLKDLVRVHEDGTATTQRGYTVAGAVTDWLDYGLTDRDPATLAAKRSLAGQHIIPALGARKLTELSAEDVDRWLAAKARLLSTRTVAELKSILRRAITRAHRHRLNRGGDRHANCALHRIVLCWLRWDPCSRAYAEKRTAEGMGKKEIIRCLKRYVAREVYTALAQSPPSSTPAIPSAA
jgi:hypothetical protein